MSCHTAIAVRETAYPTTTTTTTKGVDAGPASTVRIGDRQRRDVEEALGQAMAQGYLDVTEFQIRLDQVAAATSSTHLDRLVADLPVDQLRRNDPTRVAARATASRRGVIAHTAAYLLGAVLVVALWVAIAIPTGHWYPWPIWPTIGGAIGVLAHALPVRAAVRR